MIEQSEYTTTAGDWEEMITMDVCIGDSSQGLTVYFQGIVTGFGCWRIIVNDVIIHDEAVFGVETGHCHASSLKDLPRLKPDTYEMTLEMYSMYGNPVTMHIDDFKCYMKKLHREL